MKMPERFALIYLKELKLCKITDTLYCNLENFICIQESELQKYKFK